MMLSELKPNEKAIVVAIEISDDGTLQRMAAFGLQTGNSVQCLQWTPVKGPRSYRLTNGVFAFDEDVTAFVTIELEINP